MKSLLLNSTFILLFLKPLLLFSFLIENQVKIAIDTYMGDDNFVLSLKKICTKYIADEIMENSSLLNPVLTAFLDN